ncbi:hypothetical protein Tco_0875503 [Tanacetum coccineum]|uniref:Uncharacterized protein n=1 Tax=Tanacetum coccineum TaxID=301880 RepID=A0ABQ5BSI1_9ASTR
MSGGVTSSHISSTKHKERPLRDNMYSAIRLALQVFDQRPPNYFRHDIYPLVPGSLELVSASYPDRDN